jgi:hypothetical protein
MSRGARLRRSLPSLVVLLGFLAGACGNDTTISIGARGEDIEQLPADVVPAELLGLKATQEDMTASLAGSKDSYVDGVGLYAYRSQDDLLQATLQVSKFIDDARYRDAGFRSSVVAKIGGSVPRLVRLGDQRVYLTTGSKQQIAVWFRDDYLFVLSSRDDFTQPRALLREALDIRP